jgi:hypothetical protein
MVVKHSRNVVSMERDQIEATMKEEIQREPFRYEG